MDIEIRKYNFIQELFNVDKNHIMDALEQVLKKEKEKTHEISDDTKKELDRRLEAYYKNPEDVLNWQEVKDKW